jgi:hypothetical protein
LRPAQFVPSAGFQARKSAEEMPAAAVMEAHVSSCETSQNLVQSAVMPVWVGMEPVGVIGRGAVRVLGVLGTATQ